jgi:hypothetical protein
MACRKLLKLIFLAFTVAISGCEDRLQESQETNMDKRSYAETFNSSLVSAKSKLKQKRAHLLRNSLAKILAMPPQQLCLELGRLPCTDVVHQVSLGEMDAYGKAQYEYSEHTPVTAPISLDRLVLSACSTRASLDIINTKQAVIFKDLDLSPDGRIARDDAFYQAIERLYHRALLREPKPREVQLLEQLYIDIYEREPIGAARNWALLSCYTVLSSVEFVFY